MGLQVITPGSEPLTLSDVKDYLRVDSSDDDDLITEMISAARIYVERYTGLTLMDSTLEMGMVWWGTAGNVGSVAFDLPTWPVQSITYIKYYDSNNTLQTWGSSNYQLDTGLPARVAAVPGTNYPAVQYQADAVQVRFQAGYATAAAIPESIKLAMKRLITHWYEHRAPTWTNKKKRVYTFVPYDVRLLLMHHKIQPVINEYARFDEVL